MGYRVVVDFDLCESNARCMEAAPEVFEVRDDDFLYVLDETPPDELAVQGGGGRAPLPQGGHQRRRRVTRGPAASSSSAPRSPGCGRPRSCGPRGFDGTITVVGDEPARALRPPAAVEAGAGGDVAGSTASR